MPDVGTHEVRSTNRANGPLILHPSPRDGSAPFILAIGDFDEEAATYRLVGWHHSDSIRLPRFWLAAPAVPWSAYFVPQKMLHDLPVHEFGESVE